MSVSIDFVVNGNNVNSYFKQIDDIPIVIRNRDWTPSFDGFKFALSSKVPNVPQKNHLVLVGVNSDNHFLGYIDRLPIINREKLYEFEVKNYLMKLEKYRVNFETLNTDLQTGIVDWTDEKTFTVNTADDYLYCEAHNLSSGEKLQVRSSGTLPAGLIANHSYYVQVIDTDNIRLFPSFALWRQRLAFDTATGNHVRLNFIISVSGISSAPSINSVYSNNGSEFTVIDLQILGGSGTITFIKTSGPNNPTASGTLTKVSGSGDSTITFSSWTDGGSGTHSFSTDLDELKYNDSSDYIDIPFTVDHVGNQINPENWYANPSLAVNIPDIKFIVSFRSDGTLPDALPAPLVHTRSYIARKYPGDNGFRIFDNNADYGTETEMNILDSGTGNHYFKIEYRPTPDIEYPVGIVSLSWLFEVLFRKIGAVLDTSLVDNIIFHKFNIGGTDYTWKWSEIYLVESMMYNLNQSEVANSSNIDIFSEINCLKFIQDILGKLGIAVKFIGNATTKTFLLIPQSRDVNGVIQPDDEDNFVVTDSNKMNSVDDTIIDDNGGYSLKRSFADYVSFRYNDYKLGQGYNGTIYEATGTQRINSGKTQINWWANLRFFLQDKLSGAQSKVLFPDTFGYEFYHMNSYSAIRNQTYSLLNHSREEFECKADYLSQEKWTVKELKFDIKTRRIKIVQEQNLLTSG